MTEKSTQPAANTPCPCCSERPYAQCCGPFLVGAAKPKTAEELLRSRYTAFVAGHVDYILSTHHPRTVDQVKRKEIEEWSQDSQWKGLKILETEGGAAADERATIVFHAQYDLDEKHHDHFEKSFFEKDGGEWKFVDAQGVHQGTYTREEPKTGRNDPCPCGSGKKFKKCHAA